MVARVLFPWLPPWRNTIASPPTGDLKGNKCRTPPLIHHPRPYGSPGLLPDFPASVDAYWMPCSALPGGIPALIYDLGEPVEETPILESRKDGKGTAHHSAISSPTSSHESLKIALEDHCIKCARITWFDPKQGVWSDMTKAHDKMTTATPSKLSHWAVRVAYGACGWAFLFAALSFYWALGGTAGADTVSPEIVQLARAHVPWVIAVLWITAILKVVSGFVALALIQPWGRMVPCWALLILG